MRVRPQRPTDRRARAERRPHVVGHPVQPDETPAPPDPDPQLLAERRHRASVRPEDQATYHCSCGFVFQENVSTSVACPHCGTAQAW